MADRNIVPRSEAPPLSAEQRERAAADREHARDERDRWMLPIAIAGFGVTVLTFLTAKR